MAGGKEDRDVRDSAYVTGRRIRPLEAGNRGEGAGRGKK